mgnify:CR=1 FL=1
MEDKKKTLTEYEKEISEAQEMEEANTHKRKVRSFKRMLMVTFLVVCAIPITLCMFLMVKMNRLDHRIENLVDQRGFSRSGNARHTGEHSQRKVHRQILEIVFTGTHHVQLLGLAHLAT